MHHLESYSSRKLIKVWCSVEVFGLASPKHESGPSIIAFTGIWQDMMEASGGEVSRLLFVVNMRRVVVNMRRG